MQTILLNDALGVTEQREPFQVKFVTCNLAKRTGGKIIELTDVVKVGSSKENETIMVKKLGNSNHPYPIHIHCLLEVNRERIII